MQANESQLQSLKGILQTFCDSTGLKVNYGKSYLAPINIRSDRASHLAEVFGCLVGSFPFTYLGLPLGTTKLQVKDYAPLLCRIERSSLLVLSSSHMPAGFNLLIQSSLPFLPIISIL